MWWLEADGEFHAQAYRRLGELFDARGDTAHAIDAYPHVVTLWEDADSVLQPGVTAARRRLTAFGGAR